MKISYLSLAVAVVAAQSPWASADSNKLEEVIVVASGVPTPIRQIGTAVSVFDREDLELAGAPSLAEVLRLAPGIDVSSNGGFGKSTALRIRGEDGFRTRILIDGVDISDTTGPQIGPRVESLQNSIDIERVEILRGPQGFRYGADAGGVIAIETRRGGEDLSGALVAEYGRYGTSLNSGFIAVGSETGDLFVSISGFNTEGYNAFVDDTTGEEDGYDNTTFHSKLGWNHDKGRTQLVLRQLDSENEYDNCFGTDDCENTLQQVIGALSHNWNNGDWTHNLSGQLTRIESEYFSQGLSSYAPEGERKKLEYLGEYRASDTSTVIVGGEWMEEAILQAAMGDIRRTQTALLGEWQVEPLADLYFSAGARYDDNEDFGQHTSLRLSIAQILNLTRGQTLKLRSSYGTGFRAPSLYEIDYNSGPYAFGDAAATELQEETTAGYDVGADYIHEIGFVFEATYFHQQTDELIQFDLQNYSGYLQFDGKSVSRGWEFHAEQSLGTLLTIDANYTYNNTDDGDGNVRVRRPEWIAYLNLRFNLLEDRLKVALGQRWVSELTDIDRRLEGYDRVDASVRYGVNRHFDVYARVENAFDEDYREVSNYNVPGASTTIGLQGHF